MTTGPNRKWLKRFAIGIPVAVVLFAGAFYVWLQLLLWSFNSECAELRHTVLEKQLANGDWLKVRSEPDCSPTGGPRMHLYMKASAETKYRWLAWWKGDSAKGVKPYLDAPTPIIQTPATDHLLLRSRTGWQNVAMKDIVNSVLPLEFPLIAHSANLSSDGGFDPVTNELSVFSNWGNNRRHFKLRVTPQARFQFVDFDQPPTPLSRQLDIASLHPLSARIQKSESELYRLVIRRSLSTLGARPRVLGTLPIKCRVEIEEICANTQLLAAYPDGRGADGPPESDIVFMVGWLSEPRRFSSEFFLYRNQNFEPIALPALTANLPGTELTTWSVAPHSVYLHTPANKVLVQVLVAPVPTANSELNFPDLNAPIAQAEIDRRCKRLRVVLSVDTTANAPLSAQIDSVEFDAGDVLCRGRELPTFGRQT